MNITESIKSFGSWAWEHRGEVSVAGAVSAAGYLALGLSAYISIPVGLAAGAIANRVWTHQKEAEIETPSLLKQEIPLEAPPPPPQKIIVAEPHEPAFEAVVKTEAPSLVKDVVKGVFASLGILFYIVFGGIAALGCLAYVKWHSGEECNVANSIMNEYAAFWKTGFWHFSSSPEVVPGDGTPIVLVHGYLHNSTGWGPMIEDLKKAGCGPIYTIDLGDGTVSGKFRSIVDYAKQLDEKVEKIKAETGSDKVSLVGHSMGGLISALYASQFRNSVEKVVTIGSPFKGSPLANYFGIGRNGQEMKPGSPLLEHIRGTVEESEVPFYSIASETDEIVPFDSAFYGTDPEKQFVVKDEGHLSLMVSKKVTEKVANFLYSEQTLASTRENEALAVGA